MKRVHKKKTPPYRPFVGQPYKKVFKLIAIELNKTSFFEFDDLGALRHAGFELWKRIFPDIPFPPDADVLRTQYYKDPGIET